MKDKNISLQLSEQEMIDCNTNDMNCGDGGWPTTIYNYVLKKGLTSNEAYEYLAYTDECLSARLPRISSIQEACECKNEDFVCFSTRLLTKHFS